MTDQPDNKAEKQPKARRTGSRKTIGKDKHELRIYLGRDSTGERHDHYEIFYGKASQADARIYEIKRRYLAGEPIKANSDTFGAMIDEWMEAKKLSVAESSLKTYKEVVETRIRPAFGNKMLARITADEIQRFYVKLHDEGLSFAFIRGVELPKSLADDPGEEDHRAMSADQVAKFLKAAEGNRFENLFKLAFFAGFRPGELLALRWEDFDAQARTLRVSRNIVFRKANDWYLKRPKTREGKRTLPLTEATVEVVKRQRTAQLEAKLKAGKLWTDHGFIFADSTGDPYPHWALYNDCKKILRAAGLPSHLSPKASRHTMATLLLDGGTNPKAVQERMGHSKITTTLSAYAHILPGMQAGVSEEIERLLEGKK